jgi:transketolase
MLFAAHHNLDNLVAIIDYNKMQSLTSVENTLRIEPLADKARAFGWAVGEVDGHDHYALTESLSASPWEVGKPSFLIAHTTKGKGVSFMENSVGWHYKSPSADQLAQALEEIRHA